MIFGKTHAGTHEHAAALEIRMTEYGAVQE